MQYESVNTGFEGCFTGCTSLKRVIFEDGEKKYNFAANGHVWKF